MNSFEIWAHQQPQTKEEKPSITAVAFKPDGSKVVACVGQKILIYKTSDGSLLKSLKGHKDNVYSVSFCRDGTRFASGGADKCAIIWSDEGKGIVKYSHADSVQVVAFNPARDILASCSNSDFGFWTPKEKSVVKHKLESKALSAAWTNDGQLVAIGMLSGAVTLRDLRGNEHMSIERSAPVWCLAWCPPGVCADAPDTLAVGCWDRTLSFYHISGMQVSDERQLDYFPCSLAYLNDKSFVVGGSNKAVSLFSSGGIVLCTLATQGDWIWAAAGNYGIGAFVATDHSGCVSFRSLRFPSVHDIYGNHAVWCGTGITELHVQHLPSCQVDTIECGGIIQAAHIFRRHLVIKLPSRMMVYELLDPPGRLHRQTYILRVDNQCELIALVSTGIAVCWGKKIELHDCSGKCTQEWVFDSNVRCIEVDEGPDGNEGILVGLEDGGFYIAYASISFPTFVLSHTVAIRKVAMNAGRTHVVVIDAKDSLYVYELLSKEILFREDGVTSAAFHEQEDNLLCYGGCGAISIRALQDSVYMRNIDGDIVGFRGSRIFLYHNQRVEPFDVSLSAIVQNLMESNRLDQAFRIACAGVCESVWAKLGDAALDALQFSVARDSFLRVKDYTFLELIDATETKLNQLAGDKGSMEKVEHDFRANVALTRRQYHEAAKHFTKAGEAQKAVDVFVNLRLWDEAKSIASAAGMDLSGVLLKHAAWAEESGDWKLASELYVSGKQYLKAIELIGETKEKGWGQSLMGISRQLSDDDVEALESCGKYLAESVDEYAHELLEVCKRLRNYRGYMEVCVKTCNWTEAAAVYKSNKAEFQRCPSVLPYAEWLIVQGKFRDAFGVYHQAENVLQGWRLISELVRNAIIEGRLEDASFYHWVLAEEATRDANSYTGASGSNYSDESYRHHRLMAQLYYTYHIVQEYCDESFTRLHSEALFQLAAYLVNSITMARVPEGISLARILYTFAKQARQLGAFQSARFAYEQMQRLMLPAELAPSVDFDALTIQAQPTEDNPDLMPVCYRCGSTSSVLRREGDGGGGGGPPVSGDDAGANSCSNCGHPFVRCGVNFDVLPLVEFVPADPIEDGEALSMIESASAAAAGPSDAEDETDSPFTEAINSSLTRQESSREYLPTTADEATLRALDREEVFALSGGGAEPVGGGGGGSGRRGRVRFFKNVIPEIGIAACRHCRSFFHEQDFELAALERGGRCILCRERLDNYGHL